MTLDLIAFLGGWVAGWWLLWHVPLPPPAAPRDGPRRSVSVIVPARDEAVMLPHLLSSLRSELAAADELIVVDDHSSDATPSIARNAGATVLAAPDPPEGWNPKSWACHTGAGQASGRLLVFLDADTRLAKGGLERLVGAHLASGGLYSVQPWHRVRRPVERLAALFNVVSMMGTGAFAPGRRGRPRTGAFGPCLVTSGRDYRATGGFASVGRELLDDLSLARRYRQSGLPVTIHGGRGTVEFRMYPQGFGQLAEGFTKNFAATALAVPWWTTALVALWVGALCAPAVVVGSSPALAAACYGAAAAQVLVHVRRLGSFGALTAVLYPLALAAFLAVFARSLAATLIRGRVRWKGRELATRPRPPRGP